MSRGAGGSAPIIAILLLGLLTVFGAPDVAGAELKLLGPTSLKDALQEADAVYEASTGDKLVVSYDASGTQAKDIEAGSGADLYIAAGIDWMDYLDQRKLIVAATRTNLFLNRIVLVTPKSDPRTIEIVPGFPFKSFLGDGKVAIADPALSPAGEYARTALQRLGAWNSVETSIVNAANVRTALGMVDSHAVAAGIVYETDANSDPNIHVVSLFPSASHPPIVYTVAVLAHSEKLEALRYAGWLATKEAGPFFAKQGFTVLGQAAGR
jgi:molybdate transport system substrate-binding protein